MSVSKRLPPPAAHWLLLVFIIEESDADCIDIRGFGIWGQ
jgi:hypothetical protein